MRGIIHVNGPRSMSVTVYYLWSRLTLFWISLIYLGFYYLNATESLLRKQGSPDSQYARWELSVESGGECGGGRRKGRLMGCVALIIQEDAKEPANDRTESSGSSPFLQPRFAELLQEANVSVQMCSRGSEDRFRKLGAWIEIIVPSVSTVKDTKGTMRSHVRTMMSCYGSTNRRW